MRKIKEWLAKDLEVESSYIETLYDSKIAINFLFLWNRFETHIFEKKCSFSNIKGFDTVKVTINDKIDEFIKYFYERYVDEDKGMTHLRHLMWTDFNPDTKARKLVDKVLTEDYSNVDNEDKLKFLIYVIFRYRNNMFHGNKGLNTWLEFEEPIENIMKAMISIMESYNLEKI